MDTVAAVDPDDLEQEALAAVAAATTLAELDEARVRYLGRSSELKLALREVRDRETGMALNAVREAVEAALAARQEELERAELDATARDRARRRHAAGGAARRRRARGRAARSTRRRRSAATSRTLPRPRLRDRRRPRGRDDEYNFDALALPGLASGALAARHALPRRRHAAAHGDVAVADPQDGGAAAADLHGLDRPRLPPRHDRRDALPDLPPVRGARDRQGHHDGRPEGDAAVRDARSCTARSARCASARTTSRSPSRRWSRTSRARSAAASGCPTCKHSGWIEIGGSGMVDPYVLRVRRLGPGGVHGLRVRDGHRAHRAAPPRHPGIRAVLGERPPLPEAVLMKVPLSAGCASTCASTRPPSRSPTRLSISTAEVNGDRAPRRPGRPRRCFRVGHVLEADKHPNADRLQLCTRRRRRGPAVPDRLRRLELRRGREGRGRAAGRDAPERPDARAAQAARRGVGGDDPRRGRGRPRHRPQRDHACSTTRSSPARRSPTCCRSSRRCSTSSRPATAPDLLSVYGIAREVAALFDGELAPLAGREPARGRRRAGRRSGSRIPTAARATSAGCSATSRSASRRVWLKARAPRRRRALDLERRRRDELRDARARQPAARVRLRHARTAGASSSAARRRARSCGRSTATMRKLDAGRPR